MPAPVDASSPITSAFKRAPADAAGGARSRAKLIRAALGSPRRRRRGGDAVRARPSPASSIDAASGADAAPSRALEQARALSAAARRHQVGDRARRPSRPRTPTVSDSVGWGWIVSAMSSASAPISSACTVSAISSPAPTPTIPAPSSRWRAGLEQQLREPLWAPQRERAARGGPREHRLLVLDPVALRVGLGQAHPGDLGVGVGDRRDRPRRRTRHLAPRRSPRRRPCPRASPCARASGRRRCRRSRRCPGTFVRI